MTSARNYILWILQIVAAAILLQTLYFKFTAQPESIYIFSKIGAEPIGRIASGIVELIAALLLVIPRTAWIGAFMAAGVMIGALASHLTILGIEVQGDHGQLFGLALTVFLCSITILVLRRKEIPVVKKYF